MAYAHRKDPDKAMFMYSLTKSFTVNSARSYDAMECIDEKSESQPEAYMRI